MQLVQPIIRVCDVCQRTVCEPSVRFGWQLVNYEIDLCPEHTDQLAETLDIFISSARLLGQPPRSFHLESKPTPTRNLVPTKQVRTWAKKTGQSVSQRGRLPDSLFTAYIHENHRSHAKPTKED